MKEYYNIDNIPKMLLVLSCWGCLKATKEASILFQCVWAATWTQALNPRNY